MIRRNRTWRHRLVYIGGFVAVMAAATVYMFTGCSSVREEPDVRENNRAIHVEQVDLPDGQTLTCVSYNGHGIDCNWDAVNNTDF